MSSQATIHPVILKVPLPEQQLKGRDKVAALRRCARDALALSAQFHGVRLKRLDKAENGAPLPSEGVHWSLSHKSAFVAAVTSHRPVGIDIESIKPVSDGVKDRTADDQEWRLAPDKGLNHFFRFWTAKEAVLKAAGKGLTGLDHCRVVQIVDDLQLRLTYDGTIWTVTHHWIGQRHLVAVTSDQVDLAWHVIR